MPMEITQVKNGLVRIVWTTSVPKEGISDEIFRLGCFDYFPCTDVCEMSTETAIDGAARTFKVNMRLNCIQLSSCDLMANVGTKDNGSPTFCCQNQPSAVWVNINRGENEFLTKLSTSCSWIQTKAAEVQSTNPSNFVRIPLELWMKFSTDSVRFVQ